jgi:hypothetical protein
MRRLPLQRTIIAVAKLIADDVAKWIKVAKAARIKAQ